MVCITLLDVCLLISEGLSYYSFFNPSKDSLRFLKSTLGLNSHTEGVIYLVLVQEKKNLHFKICHQLEAEI